MGLVGHKWEFGRPRGHREGLGKDLGWLSDSSHAMRHNSMRFRLDFDSMSHALISMRFRFNMVRFRCDFDATSIQYREDPPPLPVFQGLWWSGGLGGEGGLWVETEMRFRCHAIVEISMRFRCDIAWVRLAPMRLGSDAISTWRCDATYPCSDSSLQGLFLEHALVCRAPFLCVGSPGRSIA